MDESRSSGEPVRQGPDDDVVALLHARLPEELAHLPVTSAAEFRQEAWKVWHTSRPPSLLYHPGIGVRGVLAMVTGFFAIGGVVMVIVQPPLAGEVLEVAVSLLLLGGVTALLIRSKHRSNQKANRRRALNRVLSSVSAQIDREVEAGHLPLQPPGWQGKILAPL